MLEFCKCQDAEARKMCALYLCDPNKNDACKKTNCGRIYNEDTGKYNGGCTATSNPDYAFIGDDGKPIPAYTDYHNFNKIKQILSLNISMYEDSKNGLI